MIAITVTELIVELQKFPGDKIVLVEVEVCGQEMSDHVDHERIHKVGSYVVLLMVKRDY